MGTYLWAPDELAAMQAGGNAKARLTYGGPLPHSGMSFEEITRVAKQKYDDKLWYKESHSDGDEVLAHAPKKKEPKLKKKSKKKSTPATLAATSSPAASAEWDDW